MYNESLKREFISQYTTKDGVIYMLERLFSYSENVEAKLGKDLYEIYSVEEMQEIIDNVAGIRSSTSDSTIRILKAYMKWCESEKHFNVSKALEEVTKVSSEAIRKSTVYGPLGLQKYLNKLFVPEDEMTMDCVYRSIFWLAFAGVPDSEMLKIKEDEVYLDKMVIIHNDEVYPLYSEGFKAISYCKNLKSFNYNHPLYSNTISRDRVVSNYLLRGVKTDQNEKTIKSLISRKQHGSDVPAINIGRVRLSGVFYRMYKEEVEGIPCDFEALINSGILEKKRNKELKTKENGVWFVKRLRETKKDYEQWKIAYNL